MEVGAGHSPGLADQADPLAARNARALDDIDSAQVVVHRDHALPVVEQDGEPVEEEIAGLYHPARGRRDDRRALGSRDVETAVRLPRLLVEEAPRPEYSRDATFGRKAEVEAVGFDIAIRGERLREALLLARDSPEILGLGVDLAAVGECDVL